MLNYNYYNQEPNSPMAQYHLQTQQVMKELLERRKEEGLVERISKQVLEEVLKMISVRADVADAVADVKELQKAIENLGKKGGR